jgi:hypothetical protein
MHLNTTPATKPVINLTEAKLVRTAFRRSYRPGLCARTILAGIVATGTLQGLDLSQERDALEPLLLAETQRPAMRLA